MRRFLVAWGPPLVGFGIFTGALTGAVGLGLARMYIPMAPCIAVTVVSFFASFADAIDGPGRHLEQLGRAPCRLCALRDRKCSELEADNLELREALATLQLPEDGGRE